MIPQNPVKGQIWQDTYSGVKRIWDGEMWVIITSEEESRKQFEAWISAPPTELKIHRYGFDQSKFAWPGQYKEYIVQLAWEAWEESRKQSKLSP